MIDVEGLLSPISEQAPCGAYLKLDRTTYRSLRNAYNTAQSSFRQLVETPDASKNEDLLEANHNNWQALNNTTYETLRQSTKDLEILGWYIASQLFTDAPFLHLSQSLDVLKQYVELYWPTLNPMPPREKLKATDDESAAREWAEFRIKPLLQLVGESDDSTAIYVPLQLTPLISTITYGDFLLAERDGSLAVLKESTQKAFNEQELQDTLQNLAQSLESLTTTETLIAAKCKEVGASTVSFKFIKSNLVNLLKAIEYLVRDICAHWPLDSNYQLITETESANQTSTNNIVPDPVAQTESTTPLQAQVSTTTQDAIHTATNGMNLSNSAQQTVTSSAISNRDQAFGELRKLAEFFKQTEPHSPISFLLERAIRWGYMSLPELLEEMIGNEKHVLSYINQLTGMDNLDQTDLSDKQVPIPVPTAVSAPPVENQPKQTESPITSPITETTQSSGSIQDFEW